MRISIQANKHYPSIKLQKSSSASHDFQQMANATIYGTPGKMRYAHKNCVTKIQSLQNTTFLEFRRNESLLGIVALVGHQVSIDSEIVNGQYVRYFSINNLMESKGLQRSKTSKKRGALHQMMKGLFDDPEKLSLKMNGDNRIIYAFVESTNVRSLNMVKAMGFEPSRQLVTLLFSRFYPKKKLTIARLLDEQIPEMNGFLKSFYADYNLVPNFEESWSNYFIHEVNKEIVFGVQLETNSWGIHEMPGIDGWLFKKVLPHIPILNRIFQKGKIDFIGIERLYVRNGFEHLLPNFLETLCFQFGVTKSMIGVDNQSPLHLLLKTHGKLGLLDKLITPSPGLLFYRTYDLTNSEKQSLLNKPFYVSTYDMS